MYQKYGKRLFDITASALALVLLSPLLLWLAWKIKKNLGSPVIFSQIRPGKNKKLFRLYKFRSMTDDKDEKGNLLPDEERMTDFGRKLRATSLDELPELWNILKGDMSIVGPRPQLVRDMVFFNEEEMHRQDVTPGLTGLAQINGRNNSGWKERFAYDLAYIQKITLCKDLCIIWRTVFKVSRQEDIATDGMETSEDYGEWLLRQNKVSQAEYKAKQVQAKKILGEYIRSKVNGQ
ncbi:Sugar transferase involved in LPS biosynthesis (colanic, teichoic acid) [Selenomonas ruminantium]|uniref:Sugar transferase involved in LPS biosynthesis (Colanic, teichoic acid) n=1 Tax=Selenomonas ruminantium TaxID=971 RepID=A0A1I3FN21_SELRU|nr:sugar transferase [Selenomonas ruminantium]SFI12609.1 Sugar transferase involved in LPS biosynthesis (colanic, teichoic acid) [Selenomonas ruminantium]